MAPFELARPATLQDAIALLDPEDPDIRPVGGGTAVMLMMKAGVLRPTRLVSLAGIEPEHARLGVGADGALRIGGLARLSALEHSVAVREGWPMLARTLRTLSNVRVRHVATVGGNLAHADPHMDLPPVLSALGARVTVTGPDGTRTLPVEDLSTGYYETVLARDELVTAVDVPAQAGRAGAYMKVTTRAAHDWPALGVAVVLDLDGEQVRDARVFVGAATDRPTRLAGAEALLRGAAARDDAVLKRAGEAAAAELDIVGDPHGSASYKKHLLSVYLGRAVRCALAGGAGKEHA
ncbi:MULTISPECIES: FAD binding domain-containing protein [Massilia]|jgi:carbon-monoxide dehydrogenase medium subunit|uniref:Xanthine dehydrogenase family protein subunit M n=2 Tax=Massilia TaxID=149698 RepID=A0A7X3FZ74_9BURK|nr:xanthine dehydrogenase family protein subunit M [Telluria cellulosilytica]MDN4045058.1 xanthine dehydrogenase family protein subunit M [Massilia sp. YIM B02787]MVW60713.1 xanthine dehydrogenase family protein subunit M [Telluria cellulosilytica]